MTLGDDEVALDARNAAVRRTLKAVLGINVSQVLLAGAVGIAADSAGLLGAALDNLGDAAVYIVSLYAVGRTVRAEARAARLSGILLISSALGLLVEIIRRFVGGSEPIGLLMIFTAIVNSATNLLNLRLLRSHRERGAHMKASWIFTINDMAANAGIVLSGLAVILFGSPLPDLLIGLFVVALVVKGGWEILEEARQARRAADQSARQSTARR